MQNGSQASEGKRKGTPCVRCTVESGPPVRQPHIRAQRLPPLTRIPVVGPTGFTHRLSGAEPSVEVRPNELVVGQVRVGAADAVDRLGLAVAEALVRVQAPRPCKQSLAAEYLVNPGDADSKPVGRVEDRRICVREFAVETEQLGWNSVTPGDHLVTLPQ